MMMASRVISSQQETSDFHNAAMLVPLNVAHAAQARSLWRASTAFVTLAGIGGNLR